MAEFYLLASTRHKLVGEFEALKFRTTIAANAQTIATDAALFEPKSTWRGFAYTVAHCFEAKPPIRQQRLREHPARKIDRKE